jgi:protein required for attachment to host cells
MTEGISTGTTWLIVSDGDRFRAVTPIDRPGQFGTVLSFDSVAAHWPSRETDTHSRGSILEDVSTTGRGMNPGSDVRAIAEYNFTWEVAHQVGVHVGEYDRLVLVAPDHALCDLRAALGEGPRAKIVGTLAKDLTKTPDRDLMVHLSKWWCPPPVAA